MPPPGGLCHSRAPSCPQPRQTRSTSLPDWQNADHHRRIDQCPGEPAAQRTVACRRKWSLRPFRKFNPRAGLVRQRHLATSNKRASQPGTWNSKNTATHEHLHEANPITKQAVLRAQFLLLSYSCCRIDSPDHGTIVSSPSSLIVKDLSIKAMRRRCGAEKLTSSSLRFNHQVASICPYAVAQPPSLEPRRLCA